MRRLTALALTALALSAVVLSTSGYLFAQGRIKQHGRAIVEYRSPEVRAVAAYEYSQRNHAGTWLLVEFGVQADKRIAVHRNEISLITPDERMVPVAAQEQFLEDHQELNRLLQNARIWRRPLGSYFVPQPLRTIRFFAAPGQIVHDSAVSNPDEVAAGDLFFKSPNGRWDAGTYRLVLNHEHAKAELPITLQ